MEYTRRELVEKPSHLYAIKPLATLGTFEIDAMWQVTLPDEGLDAAWEEISLAAKCKVGEGRFIRDQFFHKDFAALYNQASGLMYGERVRVWHYMIGTRKELEACLPEGVSYEEFYQLDL